MLTSPISLAIAVAMLIERCLNSILSPSIQSLTEDEKYRRKRAKRELHDGKTGSKGRSVWQTTLANQARLALRERQIIHVGVPLLAAYATYLWMTY